MALQWLESYLPPRRLVVSGVSSDTRALKSGIPRGSKLGPVLFLFYVNASKSSFVFRFASNVPKSLTSFFSMSILAADVSSKCL